MTDQRRTLRTGKAAWPLGLLLASLTLMLVYLTCNTRFATNDDTLILRQMMGFGVSELPDFNLYIHFLLFYPLRWLSLLWPGMPWFSYLQLFLLWLAAAVLSKSILQCFHNHRRPLWQGLLAAVLFLCAFVWRYMAQVSYTVTAALLGAAAVLQLLSIPEEASNGRWIRSALLSLLMAVLGYAMRQLTALPSLACCGLALLVQGIRRFQAGRDWKKPLLATLLIVAVVFGLLCGLREIEINTKPGVRHYVDWQKQRIRIWDYHDLNDLPEDVRAQYGLTDGKMALLSEWYLMDGDMDVETLTALGDALEAQADSSLGARLGEAVETLKQFPANEPLATRSLPVLAGLVALVLVGLHFGRGKRLAPALGLLFGGLGLVALCRNLGMQGRLPMRGLLTVVLPFAALVMGLLPACLPASAGVASKTALCLLAAATLVLCGLYMGALYGEMARRPLTDEESGANDALGNLDDFGVNFEEYLLIVDNSLVGDTRMFPTTEFGISKNLVYWGGWNLHSPAYHDLLARYGYDAVTWTLENFYSDNVLLMRGMMDPPPTLLVNALGEIMPTDWYLDSDWGGVYSFYFAEY